MAIRLGERAALGVGGGVDMMAANNFSWGQRQTIVSKEVFLGPATFSFFETHQHDVMSVWQAQWGP
jgi:hypothetical protein